MKKANLLASLVGILILVSVIVSMVNMRPSEIKDENIVKCKEVLEKAIQGDIQHYTVVDGVTSADGQFEDKYYIEYYTLDKENLRIDKSSSSVGEHHEFFYKGYLYALSTGTEMVSVHRHSGRGYRTDTPNAVASTYYYMKPENVTYEETATHIIFTYDNQSLIGKAINGSYKEENKGGYTSAVSVIYFDKNWKLEKLEIIEKWISITNDGQEYERIRKIDIEYHDTSEEKIKKIFEEEYKMLEDLLEDV